MGQRSQRDDRGLSPVIGAVLLVAIAIALVSLTAVMIFGTTDETPPAPTSKFEVTQADGEYVLEVTAGDTIDGDRVTIQGLEDPNVLAGREFAPGDSVKIAPTERTIEIIWEEQAEDGVSYELQTFAVEPRSPIVPFPTGTVFTGTGSEIVQIAGDGGAVRTLYDDATVYGLGAAGTAVSDGATVPYVADDETVGIVDVDGEATEVADSGDISGSIATNETRLAVDRWDGSAGVFFVDQNHDTIYRATPSTAPVVVATPSNGAQSVLGTGDIDSDGDDELVFGDGSQTVRSLESDGSISTTGVTSGSNNGIGTGSLADFDGDGATEVGVVDGGNDIQFVDATGGEPVTASDVSGGSAPDAKKAPTAAADVDGDFETELVYVGADNSKLRYLDNLGGTIDIEYLEDEDGNRINGSDETGAS